MSKQLLHEINLKEDIPKRIKNFSQKLTKFASNQQVLLKALFLSFVATIFFVGISFPDLWQSYFLFRQRWFGLISIAIYILSSLIFVLITNWGVFRSISVFIQSNILALFAFAYFLRLNIRDILIFGFSFNTAFLFLILSGLIFLVNLNLFGENKRQHWLLIPQVMLFALQAFSLLSFTDTFITSRVSFSSDWLNVLFNIHPFFWLTLCGLAITTITVFSYKIDSLKEFFKVFGIFAFCIIQIIFLIYIIVFIDISLNLTYWNLTLMTLIFWDWLDGNFRIIAQKLEDSKFYPRLTISTIYHFILFLIVLLAPQISF